MKLNYQYEIAKPNLERSGRWVKYSECFSSEEELLNIISVEEDSHLKIFEEYSIRIEEYENMYLELIYKRKNKDFEIGVFSIKRLNSHGFDTSKVLQDCKKIKKILDKMIIKE